MVYPNLNEEKKLWRAGFERVAGLDESGRGPLAGPVVAAAVILEPGTRLKFTREIKDSKKLTSKKREELFGVLTSHPRIHWAVAGVSSRVIDRINILQATKLAMERAIMNLKRKKEKGKTEFLIIDGNFGLNLNIPQKPIIKADEKVFSCAAASIIAKVYRDRIMLRYHRNYPEYGFEKHKGYPTKLHFEMLKKYQVSVIHRHTFFPCREMIR